MRTRAANNAPQLFDGGVETEGRFHDLLVEFEAAIPAHERLVLERVADVGRAAPGAFIEAVSFPTCRVDDVLGGGVNERINNVLRRGPTLDDIRITHVGATHVWRSLGRGAHRTGPRAFGRHGGRLRAGCVGQRPSAFFFAAS